MSAVHALPSEMTFPMRVSASIRAHAGARGMSQVQLARAIGMAPSALRDRWHDRRQWQLEDLEEVARVFGVKPSTFCAEWTNGLPRLDSNQQPSGYRTRGHLSPVA